MIDLSCIDVIRDKYLPNNLECYVGSSTGQLAFINTTGYFQKTLQVNIFLTEEKEEQVTLVIAKFGFVVWSTPTEIKVIRAAPEDAKHIKQRITKIKAPNRIGLPDHLYQSSSVKPSIQMQAESQGGQHFYNMYVVWFNELKKYRLVLEDGKYQCKTIFEHDMGLVFFTAFNIHMSSDCFVFCQFNYPVVQPESEQEESKESLPQEQRKVVPSLTWQWIDQSQQEKKDGKVVKRNSPGFELLY